MLFKVSNNWACCVPLRQLKVISVTADRGQYILIFFYQNKCASVK